MNLFEEGSKPSLMGILNVTPDSFSDGGRHNDPGRALAHGLEMVRQGADIVDVGGESTRPGSVRVPADEQLRRVIPVVRQLRRALPADVHISVDTTSAAVAAAALEQGATIINDVSAGREDAGMFDLVARSGAFHILMHMQGTPATMQDDPQYQDVIAEITAFLRARAQRAQEAGVSREKILLDPGIGFGKTGQHNMDILANLRAFTGAGYPVLVGASRKRFMRAVCRETGSAELAGATCATTVFAVMAGVQALRVHDVQANRQALDMAWALSPILTPG